MLVILVGLMAGILSGLAVGGGTLLVPALVLMLGVKQHVAQGVTLAAFLPTALIAALTHYKHGNVNLRMALLMATGTAIGAIAGASAAGMVSEQRLRQLFGLFLIFMGIYELLMKEKAQAVRSQTCTKKN